MAEEAINSKELVMALERLERERNIKKEEVFKTIEDALVSALRKHMGKSAQITARMDPETGVITAEQQMKVVEFVVNPETEMTLAAAQKRGLKAEAGQDVIIPLEVREFSRIAAQIAKQVLIQKIRDIERDNIYREFKPREGEVVTGLVRRFSDRDIVVDLGKAEAILPYSEQIRKERYSVNSRVKAVIYKVWAYKDVAGSEDPVAQRLRPALMRMEKYQRGPFIVLSRSTPLFMQRLFETEVPEVSEKIVELVSIERDPGFRAKVIVRSRDLKVDPVGACVGMRGMRIRGITNELSGERVDLILYTIDAQQMIANAMSPAAVRSVRITDKENKKALVVVPDDQLPIAIGKDWQNIRLASKITGWELEVKSESQLSEESKKVQAAAAQDLTSVEGIGPKIAEVLIKAGLTDISRLATLTPDYLSTLQGIGDKTAEKIVQGAQKYMQEKAQARQSAPAEESTQETAAVEAQNDGKEHQEQEGGN
ncbi:MAG: transcription termination/antitermination protein NusA [Elusimicrobia bacterium]|nr:transcription termination/antitermination protein NusA [Elusimicrobiota bacterium]